jgi:hypothetical protein
MRIIRQPTGMAQSRITRKNSRAAPGAIDKIGAGRLRMSGNEMSSACAVASKKIAGHGAEGFLYSVLAASAQLLTNTAPAAWLNFGSLEILKLAQAKVGDDTIIACIKYKALVCNLNADQIIYLR